MPQHRAWWRKPCPSQDSSCSPAAGTSGMEAFTLAWQPSWNRGSGSSSHPKGLFLSSCSCLPRMPASSPLSLQPSLEFQSADEVQEGGWGGGQASSSSKYSYLGAGATRNPGKKIQRTRGWDKENICSESQQTKEDGGVFTQDHCAKGCRQGTEDPVSSWGWSEPSPKWPYLQAAGYSGFSTSTEKLLIREMYDLCLLGSFTGKSLFNS